MKTKTQRTQILETLDVLDQAQTEQVLAYMKQMIQVENDKAVYRKFKREAMREIRDALNRERVRK